MNTDTIPPQEKTEFHAECEQAFKKLEKNLRRIKARKPKPLPDSGFRVVTKFVDGCLQNVRVPVTA